MRQSSVTGCSGRYESTGGHITFLYTRRAYRSGRLDERSRQYCARYACAVSSASVMAW